MLALAERGAGLAYTLDAVAARALAKGTVREVLHRHMPQVPGLFLYFPATSKGQPKLRAFIDFMTGRRRGSKARAA
jgi:DNA-binding transcriptional LysR family regulator